jgi:hypothetical protein
MPTLQTMLFSRSQRPSAAGPLLLLALLGAWSCASEETPRFGEPGRVAGGVGAAGGAGGSGGSGGSTKPCTVNTGCTISFKKDIFPVLDTKSSCAFSPGCHGDGKGNMTLIPGDAANYYDTLTKFVVNHDPDSGPYIVPCDPAASKLPCNLQTSDGANPNGKCASAMPKVGSKGPTLKQLQDIEDWITCGAPYN